MAAIFLEDFFTDSYTVNSRSKTIKYLAWLEEDAGKCRVQFRAREKNYFM